MGRGSVTMSLNQISLGSPTKDWLVITVSEHHESLALIGAGLWQLVVSVWNHMKPDD